jgi:hypothetical protein
MAPGAFTRTHSRLRQRGGDDYPASGYFGWYDLL